MFLNKLDFLLESSPWWLLACGLCGALYAYILYQKQAPWSKTINRALAFTRFLFVSLLALLLVNLFIKSTKNTLQKRTIGILIDNSASMLGVGKAGLSSIQTALFEMAESLKNKGIEVRLASLNQQNLGNFDSLAYNQKNTNLGQLIRNFKTNTEGANVTDLVLLSDGINNQGLSPLSYTVPFAIHSLAVGDTSAKRDIFIKNLIANNLAYKGNNFIVQAEIAHNGYSGQSIAVSIANNGATLQTKNVVLGKGPEPALVTFNISSNTVGLNRLQVIAQVLPGEYNSKNNRRALSIDIVDGRQNILILAATAHPDIKAIKSILDKDENYEVETVVANQLNNNLPSKKRYDLAILHQIPAENNVFTQELTNLRQNKTPIFYILGNQSSLAALNLYAGNLKIEAASNQTDRVGAYFNSAYNTIEFDQSNLKILERLPPITVPYGDIKSGLDVILRQKVGNVLTSRPLLMVQPASPRVAYFLGEGLWGWRMEEFAVTEKNEVVDDIFSKLIQYLSAKEDTRKLRIYPAAKEIEPGDAVQLETETYNDVLQKIYNQKINLKLSSANGFEKSYQYQNQEGNSSFNLSGLAAGQYKYTATANINGKLETTNGEFIVREGSLELENLQADHQFLQNLAKNSGGKVFFANQIAALEKYLLDKKSPDVLQSEEETKEIINWPWILLLIILLAAIEWATRKYMGGY